MANSEARERISGTGGQKEYIRENWEMGFRVVSQEEAGHQGPATQLHSNQWSKSKS